MRAVRDQLRRSASGAFLLGSQRPRDGSAHEELELTTRDGRTALDESLSKIGFGTYQKKLLVLCGCGWLADNMWLQCVAVILPRVQDEWQVSDKWIGSLSSSIFLGMMIGAWSWGSYSDSFGRTVPFKGTLLLTTCFGVIAGFASSFAILCLCFFGLGLGVGGSMPTDGTVFLENLPEEHHYLLTALSVFFSLGSILTSTLAVAIVPSRSCPEGRQAPCDVATQNTGWRLLLGALSILTLLFFSLRLFFFRLHESAKYLVTTGQSEEAVQVLQQIADHNGSAFNFVITDVDDGKAEHNSRNAKDYSRLVVEDDEEDAAGDTSKLSPPDASDEGWRRTLQDYIDRISCLLQPRYRTMTLLVWTIWFTVSAGYTMFNVFLPTFLEEKLGDKAGSGNRLESLIEYCIYTIAGLPGSLVGAYLETRMGKKEAMALSTFATAIGILLFAFVSSRAGTMLVSIWISFQGTLMYAIIYGYTPRLFPVAYRGSATGIASALSRLAGMSAPIITGIILAISRSLPLYLAAALFLGSAVFMAVLPEQNQ